MLPIAKTTPIAPGDKSSWRTAYTRKIANITLPKKLKVAVEAAIQRRYRWPKT